jgi:transcriptional regulator with XRE-family HTH domain
MDRLRTLRKALKLTQSEFAKRLGLKPSSISLIEVGSNELSEKNIKLLHMVFNVNEAWIRTGEGEMFSSAPYETEFFEIYKGLMPETQAALLDLAKKLLVIQRKTPGSG